MDPESEFGNVEYKSRLNPRRLDELATQLRYRLREGDGVAIYFIGVNDDGRPTGLSSKELEESFKILCSVAKKASAIVVLKEELEIEGNKILKVVLREKSMLPRDEICIVALGNVDAGKTTLIASLITGELDDGRGRLLPYVSRHPHEIKLGRTSSIARVILGFASDGSVVNRILPKDEAEIARHSSKLIRFIDLAGHEKYLRTTARGLMASEADYVMYVISYTQALSFERYPMAREHLGLAIVLNLPFFIVFTKMDLIPSEEMLNEAVRKISRVIRRFKYIPVRIRDSQEPVESLAKLTLRRFVPIFEVSNATGEGHQELLRYLNSLPPYRKPDLGKNFLMYVDEIWTPRGVGLIVGGLILRGTIRKEDELIMGPLDDSSWQLVRVRSLRVHDINVDTAYAGQYVTIALDGVQPNRVEKGVVLLSKDSETINVSRFRAKVWILHHPTTIREGYQTVAHVHAIRWPVIFEHILSDRNSNVLRTGDIGLVDLLFQARYKGKQKSVVPRFWYIEPGMRLLLRDGRCRAIGMVEKILD